MKLPVISGRELVRKLQKHGFVVVRQRGSHIRVEKNDERGIPIKITVPDHREIKKGTLHRILKEAHLRPEDLT